MTTGWWFGANPYAGQMNYLDYVIPSTRTVTSPTITPEGVVQSDAGASSGPPAAESAGLNVGEAAQASAQHGLISPNALSKGSELGQIALAFAGVPTVATGLAGALFGATNALSGFLAGFNIDPETGLAVNSAGFQALAQGAPYGAFFNPSSPAVSPLSAATVGPLSANEAGFALSPFSTGTPFSANPTGVPSASNFGRGMDSAEAPEGNPSGVTAGNVSGVTGISGMVDGPTASGAGPAPSDGPAPSGEGNGDFKRGGLIPNAHPGAGDDEPIKAQGGEFVVRRSAAAKYRTLLEQINRGAHPNVVAHHASKLAQRVAR